MGLEILMDKVIIDPVTGCWNWQKSKREGYGQIMVNSKPWTAHRYAYTVKYGEIPEGMLVRHKCNNRACCNPDHLVIGTDSDNWKDSEQMHREGHIARCSPVQIEYNGFPHVYLSYRHAREVTGLPMGTLVKYTSNGIFDVESYRASCIKRGLVPKV